MGSQEKGEMSGADLADRIQRTLVDMRDILSSCQSLGSGCSIHPVEGAQEDLLDKFGRKLNGLQADYESLRSGNVG